MVYGEDAPKRCARSGCENTFVAHRWADENTKGPKWFHQKNGYSWCPLHIPNWVSAWRDKKKD
jgi:hypothetical protein